MKAKSKNSTVRAKKVPAAKITAKVAKKPAAKKKTVSPKEPKRAAVVRANRVGSVPVKGRVIFKSGQRSGSFIEIKSAVKKTAAKRIPPEVAKIQNMSDEELDRYTEEQFRGKKRISLAELFPNKVK